MRLRALAVAAALLLPLPALAAGGCGGTFPEFVAGLKSEARANGYSDEEIERFFAGVRQSNKVLKHDRGQGTFRKTFLDFLGDRVSTGRLNTGRAKIKTYRATFDQIQKAYGVPAGVLAGYWGLETDFGAVLGDINTRDALVTLAHDCRRPELFRPQVFAAIELSRAGRFDPARAAGAWAGEIGQFQMLPADVLRNGADGDGDGRVDVVRSSQDALVSAGRMLSGFGWRPNEPWLQEVVVPADLDWSKTGLQQSLPVSRWQSMGVRARDGALSTGLEGSILLPMGRKGPAFLAYPNYRVYFNWNKSFVYATTAAYFATRLEGAPALDRGNPEPGLSAGQMVELQKRLAARGHDVGRIDGILGQMTRQAVQKEQVRLGVPADGWPTKALLAQL